MDKKFKLTPRELILSNKDYSKFTKNELIIQYDIIMNQYDDFKNKMTVKLVSESVNPKLSIIQEKQNKVQENMHANALREVDSHLKIIKDLIDRM